MVLKINVKNANVNNFLPVKKNNNILLIIEIGVRISGTSIYRDETFFLLLAFCN